MEREEVVEARETMSGARETMSDDVWKRRSCCVETNQRPCGEYTTQQALDRKQEL